MNIVMIGPRKIYPEPQAGLDFYVRELAHSLASQGHKVTIYCHHMGDNSISGTPASISVKSVWTVKKHHLDTLIYSFLASLLALFEKEAIIHYHGGSCLFAWLQRLGGKKTIVTIHSREKYSPHISQLTRFFYFFSEWVGMKSAHQRCCVSKTLQEELQKKYKNDIFYMPIGLKPQNYFGTSMLNSFGLEPKKYLLFMGRLEKGKGIEFLLKTYQTLNDQIPYPLVIAGKPLYDENYLQELKFKSGPRVLFLGHVSGCFKKELLANALLYVQASESEGLSISLLEAMSFGCPILASNIPQNLEALGEAGYFFQNRNSNDFETRLKKLLSDTTQLQKMGEKTKRRIVEKFSWERFHSVMKQCYMNAF